MHLLKYLNKNPKLLFTAAQDCTWQIQGEKDNISVDIFEGLLPVSLSE